MGARGIYCTNQCKPTIILVDDVGYNLIPLYEILRGDFGIATESFEAGVDAIALYQKRLMATCCRGHIKLILTDIQMPAVDGFRLTNSIRSIEKMWFPLIKRDHFLRWKTKR
jgi:CheY-like chemotaxis protein